jgi:hypothetical protein
MFCLASLGVNMVIQFTAFRRKSASRRRHPASILDALPDLSMTRVGAASGMASALCQIKITLPLKSPSFFFEPPTLRACGVTSCFGHPVYFLTPNVLEIYYTEMLEIIFSSRALELI